MAEEQSRGWHRLAQVDLGDLVTVAQLSEVTGLSEGTIRRQLGPGRWGIQPAQRQLGGALEYPAAAIRERAAGPGRGNRTAGLGRSAAVRRGWETRSGDGVE